MKMEMYSNNINGKIYLLKNCINNEVYVGATTKTIESRIKDHIQKAYKDAKNDLQNAILTYGIENFEWQQIDTACSSNELAKKEKEYIIEYDSKKNGYNSTEGGEIKKIVYKYNIDGGTLNNRFDCLQDAADSVDSTKQCISSVCNSVNQTYGSFYWSYDYKEPFVPKNDRRKKIVLQFDLERNIISTFKSVADASRQTGISKTCISRVCRKERDKTHDFIFRYE